MEELILEIMQYLEIDGEYAQHVDHQDTALIAEVRSAGRKAGRRLGRKVRTVTSKLLCSAHGNHTVVVVYDMDRGQDDEELQTLRMANAAMLLDNYLKS